MSDRIGNLSVGVTANTSGAGSAFGRLRDDLVAVANQIKRLDQAAGGAKVDALGMRTAKGFSDATRAVNQFAVARQAAARGLKGVAAPAAVVAAATPAGKLPTKVYDDAWRAAMRKAPKPAGPVPFLGGQRPGSLAAVGVTPVPVGAGLAGADALARDRRRTWVQRLLGLGRADPAVPTPEPAADGHRVAGRAGKAAAGGGSSWLMSAARGVAYGATLGVGLGLAQEAAGFAGGLKDAVVESVKLAGSFEQTRLSFETMLGSAGRAERMLADLRDLAADSPLTFGGAAKVAQGLVAAGVAADQAVPTVRMLADVSAAAGDDMADSLRRVSYAYGQVATAGRLYGTELRQFTEANVPIIDALATALQRPKDQVRGLVEAGQVGFPDLVRAFKGLTEEGGKFYGLSAKYGQSFLGQVERLKDGVEVLRREFGQMAIDELGLKGAAQDLGRFTDRVRANVDALRPAVRLAGDLAKGLAQVGFELTRGAGILAQSGFARIADSIPGLARLPEQLREIGQDLQNWRIDPRKVAMVGQTLGESLLDALDTAHQALAEIGVDLDRDLVKPMLQFGRDLKTVFDDVKATVDAIKGVTKAPDQILKTAGISEEAKPYWTAFRTAELDRRWQQEMSPRWKAALQSQGPLSPPLIGSLSRDQAAQFGADQAWALSAAGGAAMPDLFRTGLGLAPAAPTRKSLRGTYGPALGVNVERLVQGYEAAQAERDRQRANELATGLVTSNKEVVSALGGTALAFAGLTDAAKKAAQGLDRVQVPYARPVLQQQLFDKLTDPDKGGGPLDQFRRRMATAAGLADTLRGESAARVGALGGGLMAGLDTAKLPAEGLAREAADALDDLRRAAGLGDRGPHLPDAAELGSREFARMEALLANPNAQGQDVLSELRAIKLFLQQQEERNLAVWTELIRWFREAGGPPVTIGGGH